MFLFIEVFISEIVNILVPLRIGLSDLEWKVACPNLGETEIF